MPITDAILPAAVSSARNDAEASNNHPITSGTTSGTTNSRNSIRGRSITIRGGADEDDYSESEDSDSNSDVEDLDAVSADNWQNVENSFGKLNPDGPVYKGESTILRMCHVLEIIHQSIIEKEINCIISNI